MTRAVIAQAVMGGLVIAALGSSAAFARQGAPPRSWEAAQSIMPLAAVEPMRLAAIQPSALRAEDDAKPQPGPLRFALPVAVDLTPTRDGEWETLPDGGRLWRARVHVPGATDLNFGFTTFRVPAGATLHIVSEGERYFEGPYGVNDVKEHGELWTPPVPGASATLELFVPADAAFEPAVALTQVGAGYRELFMREQPNRPFAKMRASCNIDVACEQGNAWRDQIRAVAGYSFGGSLFCTGTLIADVPQSRRPFFLTANHCGLSAGNVSSLVVFWNFEAATCGGQGGGSLADNQSGATFRAARTDVDMALVELDSRPPARFNAYYAGWDRSGNTPQGTVGIHHPSGDLKSIAVDNDPLSIGSSCIGGSPSDSHWYVNAWDEGTTEPGSSGSGLFHRASKRLVGFLSGGVASCSNTGGFDCYGRFSEAWDGPSSGQRLRDWLDPNGNGPRRIDGFDASGGTTNPPACPETLGNGRFCTACGPCSAGQGDCDNDSECAPGLSCVDNAGAQFGFAPGVDVCLASTNPPPPPPPLPPGCSVPAGSGRFCTECGPCGNGEGDCDNDSECASGLSCVDNVGAQFGFAPGVDVCMSNGTNPPPPPGCTLPTGNGRFCTECGPCGNGEGDCDNDGECAAGLSCVDNVGAQFGFAPGVDVCMGEATCTANPGVGNFCDVCGPCGNGEGDCDRDSDCAAGLVCVDNIGAQFGFAPGVDVCVPGS